MEYAYQVLDALDFRYGPSHGEYMLTETGPVLIEAASRPMGGHFPKPLLDQLLGHHLTDVSLDSYLDPEAFERDRNRPYRTNGFLMNKFFITPQGGAVDSYPVLTILRCLRTMAGGSLAPAFTDFRLATTVDLETAPGNILLYSQDENAVWRDYEILRTIEQRCFSALFEMSAKPERYPEEAAPLPSLEGLEGRVYVLADEKPETPPSGQVTYLTPEAFLPEGAGPGKELADGAVFMMRGKYSLEERANLLRRLTGALRPGGRILIPEEIYRYCSVGRTGMEILLTAFGVRLEVPVYGSDRSIVGTVESCG